MRSVDLIMKKRRGGALSGAEIEFLIKGFVAGSVADYQMAALAMAICFQGMSVRETADLTLAMARSGETVDLAAIPGRKVDKHSTGGVGDTTTLVLIPLVAAAGAAVAKMSGRGLGHTGGTLDKLESFPGLRVELTREQFIDQVRRVGAAVVGQTADLVPADKKLYALRDVTATVDSVPLIAASVMSKKIAGGADAVVLDVKTGSGAFMTDEAGAFRLAEAMVGIGAQVGLETVALVTDMDQPLGRAVGHSLEVQEAIDTLAGRGPADLTALCLALGAQMLTLAGVARDEADGRQRLAAAIAGGQGLAKLRELVAAQGGDPRAVDDSALLPRAPLQLPVPAPRGGFVQRIDALAVGQAVAGLGAGRTRKEDPIDRSVGVVLAKKVGDPVVRGEPLATVHAPDSRRGREAVARLRSAIAIGAAPVVPAPLIRGLRGPQPAR